jgi:hypothetical protein
MNKQELLVKFQIYLADKGLIMNPSWNFEYQAKRFLESPISVSCKKDINLLDCFQYWLYESNLIKSDDWNWVELSKEFLNKEKISIKNSAVEDDTIGVLKKRKRYNVW